MKGIVSIFSGLRSPFLFRNRGGGHPDGDANHRTAFPNCSHKFNA